MAKSNKDKRAFWQNHVDQWRKSGLSQAKYCLKENISFHSFSWWKTRGLKSNKSDLSFVPVVIKETEKPAAQQSDIHLILPNQTKLVLPATLPLNNLVSIIKIIGGLS